MDTDGQQDSNAWAFRGRGAGRARDPPVDPARLGLFGLGPYGEEKTSKEPNPDTYRVEALLLAAQLPLTELLHAARHAVGRTKPRLLLRGGPPRHQPAQGSAVQAQGGWIEGVYDLNTSPSPSRSATASTTRTTATSRPPPPGPNQRTFAALFYKVTSSFMVGGEYSVIKTGFKAEDDVTDNRLQFSGQLTY